MEKFYNKLVRDKIPEIIISNGGIPFTRKLNENEYRIELERKLNEEFQEVVNATTTVERVEELADMIEVISSLARLEGKSIDDVMEISLIKREKRGSFNERLFLEKVEE